MSFESGARNYMPTGTPEDSGSSEAEHKFLDGVEELKRQGAGELAARWLNDYEISEPGDLGGLYSRFENFMAQREDALFSLEIQSGLDEHLVEEIKQLDADTKKSFGNSSLFQGNGGTAEVYEVLGHPSICFKFITEQDAYNEGNSIRREFSLLEAVSDLRIGKVRVPKPFFLRIHPRDGHAYGMEKINGKSLSQILENPRQCPELVAVAQQLDRNEVLDEVVQFITVMHTERRITHNDLFKRNLMLDDKGNVFVIDFGKATLHEVDNLKYEMQQQDDITKAKNEIRSFFKGIDNISI